LVSVVVVVGEAGQIVDQVVAGGEKLDSRLAGVFAGGEARVDGA
jgi:hypothetical protein